MSKHPFSKTRSAQQSDHLDRYLPFLAKPALVVHEADGDYDRLRRELFNELRPESVLEAQYIDDVVYNSWQIRRLRQAQADLVKQHMIDMIEDDLAVLIYFNKDKIFPKVDNYEAARIQARLFLSIAMAGDKGLTNDFVRMLWKRLYVSVEIIHARAIEKAMPTYSKLEQMIHQCERQRQGVFKDFVFISKAKAMLLEQRSNEVVAETPSPADVHSIIVEPDSSTAASGDQAANGSSAMCGTSAANVPGPAGGFATSGNVHCGNTILTNSNTANVVLPNTVSVCEAAANTSGVASG